MSHDLKSPLVTIRTFVGYLEQDLAASDQERVNADFRYIRGAAEKMAGLLDQVLELSRIGRKANPPEDIPAGALALEAVNLLAGPIAQRGVRVDIGPLPVVVTGDRVRLLEVFQNLIENAVKFIGDSPDPHVEVGVALDGAEPVFFVRDNGKGIDARHAGRLFGLFEKLEAGTDGSGIGLALVKRIVETHGGRAWAESEGLGHGSTFFFTLADVRPANPKATPP